MQHQTKPILSWVREDNHDVVLSGAVLAGKLVRLQAVWPPSGGYMGPERFAIHSPLTQFFRGSLVQELWAGLDGPPRTHSDAAWQTGKIRRIGQQQRYYFTDTHHNKSGPLVVSNVKQYTTEPKVGLQAQGTLGVQFVGQTYLMAEAGMAATKIMIGATADPTVRIRLITNTGSGDQEDLLSYFNNNNYDDDWAILPFLLYQTERRPPWSPVLATGGRTLTVDVDNDHPAEITIVPENPYEGQLERFMVAFALRVEDVDDPEKYILSDIVTVQGGHVDTTAGFRIPEGSVYFDTR
jgi:hypothetical protein